MAHPALERLRPPREQGHLVAAGAVALATGAALVDARMVNWSSGAKLLVMGLAAALLLTLALLARDECSGGGAVTGQPIARDRHDGLGGRPSPHRSVLLVAGLILLNLALFLLARVLGANASLGAGAAFWTLAVTAACAGYLAWRTNSAACTLIGAVAGGIALLAFVGWVGHPRGMNTYRTILLVITVLLGLGAFALRTGRRHRHSVQLVNGAGLAALTVGATLLVGGILGSLGGLFRAGRLGSSSEALGHGQFGWKLWILIAAGLLIAYAAHDREPGPGYIGVLLLFVFVAVAGPSATRADYDPVTRELTRSGASLIGWPLFLVVVGLGALAAAWLLPRRRGPRPLASEKAPVPAPGPGGPGGSVAAPEQPPPPPTP